MHVLRCIGFGLKSPDPISETHSVTEDRDQCKDVYTRIRLSEGLDSL